MSTAFIFPGQGSQAVGMGKALAETFPAARAVFEEVDAALGEALSDLAWNGPLDALTLTANAQPALMAASLAAVRVLEQEAGLVLARDAAFVAGHSLGEYSALAAVGSFSIADAARLLRLRGAAMQAAVPVGEGAMAAILGLDYEKVAALAQEASAGEACDVANDNAPGQVVVSGAAGAVRRAVEIAKREGAMRAILLPVSAPFHCRMIGAAAEAMQAALAQVNLAAPAVPLVANVTAAPVTAPDAIRDLLVRQVTGTVRWRESVAFMARAGVSRMVEVGSGKVLGGLVKRIAREVTTVHVGGPADIAAFVALARAPAA
ncbi:MAG TPA: ACP S-malonyltransferase [Xanthobacteraceae bacterium]|nr:ACP S-malonyltransferase [Xanthobacteraceae bacterium]